MSTDFGTEKVNLREALLRLLSDRNWHTHIEMLVGGVRYSARLLELKRLGYKIQSEGKAVSGKRYRLLSNKPGRPQGKKVKVYLDESDARAIVNNRTVTNRTYQAVNDALGSFLFNKNKL